MDAEVEKIKRDSLSELMGRRVVMIIETENGYCVDQWLPDGVAPRSFYHTAQDAAARALQLLKLTAPVTPQRWPEIAEIGDSGGHPPLSS